MEMENVFNRNLFLWAEYILSRSHVNCLLCLDEFWCELIQTLKVNKFERFFVQCHFLDEHNSSLTLHPSAVPSNSIPDTFSLSSRNLTTSQWHKLNRKIFLSFVMTKRKFSISSVETWDVLTTQDEHHFDQSFMCGVKCSWDDFKTVQQEVDRILLLSRWLLSSFIFIFIRQRKEFKIAQLYSRESVSLHGTWNVNQKNICFVIKIPSLSVVISFKFQQFQWPDQHRQHEKKSLNFWWR